MKNPKSFLIGLLSSLAIVSARADVADTDITVVTDTAPVISALPADYSPLAGGSSGDGTDAVPKSQSGAKAEYLLAEARIGKTFEVAPESMRLGDYLVDIPDDVDWAATVDAFRASDAYGAGQIAVFPNEKDPKKRVLFTAGGSFELPWKLKDGSTDSVTYTIRNLAAERPHRIFWTTYPFNAPGISMKGKFVKLFGNPDIVNPVYAVDETSHTSNIVRGVYLETSGMTLLAAARILGDGTSDGPSGQFVVVYYDSGEYRNVIGVTVAEACGPDVTTLSVHVGERLQPYGGGYDVKGLKAYIDKGATTVDGDTAAPYLEVFSAQSKYNEKDGAVYAIAPTDGSASSDGLAASSKAHIYWEAPDLQDVLWPFEEDFYLISWNPSDPKMVVSDDSSRPGTDLFLPSDYSVELSAYMKPGDCASSPSNNVIHVREPGRFLLRLLFDDDVRYLPIQAYARTDEKVAFPKVVMTRVGQTLTPSVAAAASGEITNDVALLDRDAPGYIYEAKSAAVWNPHLYKAPAYDSGIDTTVSDGTEDPYDALTSSICLVDTTPETDPVEVWWYRSVTDVAGDALPTAVGIPSVASRYGAVWPEDGQTHEIVLVSQKGSAAASFAATGSGYYLYDVDNGAGTTNGTYNAAAESGLAVGAWLDADPEDAAEVEVDPTVGQLLWFTLGETDFALRATAVTETNATLALDVSDASGTDRHPLGTIPCNSWRQAIVSIGAFTNGTADVAVYLTGLTNAVAFRVVLSETDSVTALKLSRYGVGAVIGTRTGVRGWAADALTIWKAALSADDVAALSTEAGLSGAVSKKRLVQYDFSAFVNAYGRTAQSGDEYYCVDTVSRESCLRVCGAEIYRMTPGAPAISYGYLPVADGCTPRVYRQTDETLPGYRLNLEHAFTTTAEAGDEVVVWALRNDLRADGDAHVLVEYASDGAGAMEVFRVVDSNALYHTAASTAAVATQMVPPNPLRALADYWNEETYYDNEDAAESNDTDRIVRYRDRKLNDWARRDGHTDAHYFYAGRDDFDLPDGSTTPFGVLIPWRNRCSADSWENDLYDAPTAPAAWTWTAHWPSSAPVMQVAQTLTKAANGLPEVWNMASCEVVYPSADRRQVIGGSPAEMLANVVDLIDPVTAQTASLAIESSFIDEYGFTLGSSGTTQLRRGKYYFTGLPPSISDRFYVDATADESKRMVLIGELVEPTTGNPYLRLNVLTAVEAAALKDICTLEADTDGKKAWDAAVDALAAKPAIAPGPNDPVANYALVANGNGSGWVVIAENNSTNTDVVKEGDAIDLKVIFVTNTLYRGAVSTQTDSLNKLSELLTVQYNEAFGPATTNFTFEWYRVEPNADGTVPEIGSSQSALVSGWTKKKTGEGLTSFLLGQKGTSLAELVNAYWSLRYRPLAGTPAYYTCGENWSGWAERALAEGWVQRVLNAVTPFAQRVEDFYSCPSDIAYTMLEQIGGPYVGDVALNNDNLTEVGLLELYQTVFNKAEKMSLGLDSFDPAVDPSAAGVMKQLTLAATRMAELYQLLGAEAYSDAKNPLVSQGQSDSKVSTLVSLPSSTFCFQNQVRTLLDEELCLLRGRTIATESPNMTTTPCFNRLYWNFTKGLTEGEAAYVNNYDIRGQDGVIDASCAKAQYPQGHGDAWGHYLSSLKVYYRMLRNPKFDWYAAMGEMNVGETVVNEDYTDEQKFADSAAKLAQIGLDVVDLTARKAWKDNGGAVESAYFDGAEKTYSSAQGSVTVSEGFGYGEWAARAALGGVYNWMVVNAMLPTNDTPAAVYVDRGIAQITRPTATQLTELCQTVKEIQNKVNTLDAGMNPLGLSQNAVPMDIDPDELESKNSHFDQILERAERALANCTKVLDYANVYGSRLRQIQNLESTEGSAADVEEESFDRELISIYGTPYAGDIGTGKTYVQGYEGPDLYHYMYLDLDEYGLTEDDLGDITIRSYGYQWVRSGEKTAGSRITDAVTKTLNDTEITYRYSALGIAVTPDDFGKRLTEGSIQTSGRAYLAARLAAKTARQKYEEKTDQYARMFDYETSEEILDVSSLAAMTAAIDAAAAMEVIYQISGKAYTNAVEAAGLTSYLSQLGISGVPNVIGAGMTVITDPQSVASGVLAGQLAAQRITEFAGKKSLQCLHSLVEVAQQAQSVIEANASVVSELTAIREEFWEKTLTYWNEMYEAYEDYSTAVAALADADAAYRAEIAKGDLLQEQRETARKRRSNTATAYRYADMYNRVQRNNALTKYSTSFDTAQRYVWQLAKVYDYETGLLSSDSQSGNAFLAEIVGSRQLGYEGVSTSSATDKGLYDIVNRLKENWSVLKGRLGVNNPEKTTDEFSLRYELFRIQKGAAGDAAWQSTLEKYYVGDINADATFKRYCQPLETASASVLKEPGLVIPFATSIYAGENFFGKTVQGGDSAFSSAHYAVKINAIGIGFDGYDALAADQSSGGLKKTPYVYLVPVGTDYMRAPAGTTRTVLGWSVVDQVLPLPYAIGSTELDDEDWISTVTGLDGTTDSTAKIRRHAPFRADGEIHSTRLVGRSVWNDNWVLVIPGVELNASREQGLKTFIKGVSDIKLKIKAYARQGN